jgi:hypothetical protein
MRMWRRWFVVNNRVVYIVDQTPVAGPQDVVWRLVHDAAHLAHLGDLIAQDSCVGATIGDAPYIAAAEGFAMLAEASALGLVSGIPTRPAVGAPLFVELELLYGLVETALRFAAEVGGDYSHSALAALGQRSGLPMEGVAATVCEWRGLLGMGSCYMLGLLVALKVHAAGDLRSWIRYELDAPSLGPTDIDRLVTALDRL